MDQELQNIPWAKKPSKSSMDMQALHTCVHMGSFALALCTPNVCVLVPIVCVCVYPHTCAIDTDPHVRFLLKH